RDFHVTGVQTCALPICSWSSSAVDRGGRPWRGDLDRQRTGANVGRGRPSDGPCTASRSRSARRPGRRRVGGFTVVRVSARHDRRSEERRGGREGGGATV